MKKKLSKDRQQLDNELIELKSELEDYLVINIIEMEKQSEKLLNEARSKIINNIENNTEDLIHEVRRNIEKQEKEIETKKKHRKILLKSMYSRVKKFLTTEIKFK